MKTKIVLTFDYELFLFQSGSIDKCILEPTTKILEYLESKSIPAIFFVDILHLVRLKEMQLEDQYNTLVQNIHTILDKGHRVELHLHPHWTDAKYIPETKSWDLSDTSKYMLSALDYNSAKDCFEKAYSELDLICKQWKSDYAISSFRAGGLCIQPFERFAHLLESHGIKYECSVAPLMRGSSSTHSYDFTQYRNHTPYRFTKDPKNQDQNGNFIECPINTYEQNLFWKLYDRLMTPSTATYKIYGDGKALPPGGSHRSFFEKLKPLRYFYSLDGNCETKRLLRNIRRNRHEVLTFISHPKLLTDQSFETLEQIYQLKTVEFATYHDILT